MCETQTKEKREVPILPDKARIIERVLRMRDDYAIAAMMIMSLPERLVVEIEFSENSTSP